MSRDQTLRIRLTKRELEKLKVKAQEHQLPTSALARDLIVRFLEAA